MALQEVYSSARGGIAVVTLEPCNHTGRTGPCAEALIAADISQVYFLHPDPNGVAAGGAQTLSAAGIEVAQIEAPAELPVSDAHPVVDFAAPGPPARDPKVCANTRRFYRRKRWYEPMDYRGARA